MSAIAISKDAGTNKNNGIHNSRCSRDILIDRIYGSSPPSVTVIELNNKKGGCWGIFTNSLTC
jgi:hypothetical protein